MKEKGRMKRIMRVLGLAVLLCLLWLVSCMVSHRWRDLSESPQYESRSLTVLTYNTHRMGGFAKVGENKVVRYLQTVDADVLCLQEVEVYKDARYLTLDELRQAFPSYAYTYYDFKVYNHRRQYGNIVFSKYPLINKHTIRYASKGNITSCCDIVVEGDTLRLMVNHLESHHLTMQEQRDTLIGKIETASKLRWRQAWTVKKAMLRSAYPLLVVGDFNALPIGLTYQCLRLGMRDCFLETSRGRLGWTYQHHSLGARIDYVLCSYSLRPYRCYVERVDASDHYPVIASIEWAPGSGSR